jgi:hypothetical protein
MWVSLDAYNHSRRGGAKSPMAGDLHLLFTNLETKAMLRARSSAILARIGRFGESAILVVKE